MITKRTITQENAFCRRVVVGKSSTWSKTRETDFASSRMLRFTVSIYLTFAEWVKTYIYLPMKSYNGTIKIKYGKFAKKG